MDVDPSYPFVDLLLENGVDTVDRFEVSRVLNHFAEQMHDGPDADRAQELKDLAVKFNEVPENEPVASTVEPKVETPLGTFVRPTLVDEKGVGHSVSDLPSYPIVPEAPASAPLSEEEKATLRSLLARA